MTITVEKKGKVMILKPQGDIRVSEGDVALRKAFHEQLEAGERMFVLNMDRVRFIDSAGLGELVASLKRVREAGGDLKLSDVTQRVSEALVVTQLVRILDVYESESDAVATYV